MTSYINAIEDHTTTNQYLAIALGPNAHNLQVVVQHNPGINASVYSVGSEYFFDYDGFLEDTFQKYTFSINTDYTVSFFRDDILRWQSTNQINNSLYSNINLWMEGRSDGADMVVDNITISYNPVPEPTTMLLLGTGLLGFSGFRRKFRKAY